MVIRLPETTLLVIAGVPSAVKDAFIKQNFPAGEVLFLSSHGADTVLREAGDRLRRGLFTVIDTTYLAKEKILQLKALAKETDMQAAAVILDLPEGEILRSSAYPDNTASRKMIRYQAARIRETLAGCGKAGFQPVYVLSEADEIRSTRTEIYKPSCRKEEITGPFDIIGDIHGCRQELELLLDKLGWIREGDAYIHPEGRKAVFLGDLGDRGPDTPGVLKTVMAMVSAGNAYCVCGNHDDKLMRWLQGRNVQVTRGMEAAAAQMKDLAEEERKKILAFLESLDTHIVLDGGKLVVSHAGIKEEYIGRQSHRIRAFCLHGDIDGTSDEYGFPVRRDWAKDHHGETVIVYGHTPLAEVRELNHTYCIDTGSVFGGSLTAFRWPEKQTVSVKALQTYYKT